MFKLHPNLACKIWIADLPLCTVLLENNSHYPWLMLVPRLPNVSKLIDLTLPQQMTVLTELDQAQRVLQELFEPTQLNVAAIGNKTPQLHIHVLARSSTDPAWPGVVWDHPAKAPYEEGKLKGLVASLQKSFH